jgi:membrane protease YdiL (CAAX protease family)
MSPLQLSTFLAVLTVALLALMGRIPYVVEFSQTWRRALAAFLFTEVLAVTAFLPALMPTPDDFDPAQLWFPLLFLNHLPLAVFLVLWWRLRGDISLPRFLSLGGDRLGEKLREGLWYGAGCWLFAVVATVTMGNVAESAGGYDTPAAPPAIVVWMAGLPVLQKLAVVVVSMTIEEAFFRSFLQPRIGLVATSILFALGHFSYDLPLLVVGVFVVSLVIGRCFERTRDLLPCMIAHAVFNGVQLLVVLPAAIGSWGGLPV